MISDIGINVRAPKYGHASCWRPNDTKSSMSQGVSNPSAYMAPCDDIAALLFSVLNWHLLDDCCVDDCCTSGHRQQYIDNTFLFYIYICIIFDFAKLTFVTSCRSLHSCVLLLPFGHSWMQVCSRLLSIVILQVDRANHSNLDFSFNRKV